MMQKVRLKFSVFQIGKRIKRTLMSTSIVTNKAFETIDDLIEHFLFPRHVARRQKMLIG